MPKQTLLFCILSSILLFSCTQENKYPYSIKNFRKVLQPHLTRIVTTGMAQPYDSAIHEITTYNELIQLTKSEHPVLRVTAFYELLVRDSSKNFNLWMNHLDDTAMVLQDYGEFGTLFLSVSDAMLFNATWETMEQRNRTIDEVLTRHRYLRAAFTITSTIEPQEKYYEIIKDMATKPRKLGVYGLEEGFGDIEYALFGLAKFKKEEDKKIIAQILEKQWYILGYLSFKLMKEFPDTSYINVFEKYYKGRFYSDRGPYANVIAFSEGEEVTRDDFIKALVMQKSEKSAALLDTLFVQLPIKASIHERESLKITLAMDIWRNPCPAYIKLREKIRPIAEEIERNKFEIPWDNDYSEKDTVKRVFYWEM